jgi:hypothetical protein
MCVYGYVVMREHVHLLVDEPEETLIKSGMGKSRFLDSAGSSAFADDPAALEMTMGN